MNIKIIVSSLAGVGVIGGGVAGGYYLLNPKNQEAKKEIKASVTETTPVSKSPSKSIPQPDTSNTITSQTTLNSVTTEQRTGS